MNKYKKVQIRVSQEKVNSILTSHNFHMEHQKLLTQSLFGRKLDSLQLCLSQAKARNNSFERYNAKDYRSFSSILQKQFFVKEDMIKIKAPNEKYVPKWLIEDLLRFPKSLRTPS